MLCDFARLSPVWNDRAAREIAVSFKRETIQEARITLSGALPGHIGLSAAPGLWARATACLGGTWFGRGWTERCYEDCEFWPDASGGIVGPRVQDDPPGPHLEERLLGAVLYNAMAGARELNAAPDLKSRISDGRHSGPRDSQPLQSTSQIG